jgi:hypothetical protein
VYEAERRDFFISVFISSTSQFLARGESICKQAAAEAITIFPPFSLGLVHFVCPDIKEWCLIYESFAAIEGLIKRTMVDVHVVVFSDSTHKYAPKHQVNEVSRPSSSERMCLLPLTVKIAYFGQKS